MNYKIKIICFLLRYQQNGYEEDEDVDGITEAQRNEAAQIIKHDRRAGI